MSLYRKKPVVVEADQWFVHGDDPRVHHYATLMPDRSCHHCRKPLGAHGSIDTLEGSHIVCPGDWIITGVAGEAYPCKPDIFEQSYDLERSDI